MTVAGLVLVLAGSVFCCLAALGVLRFPDFYTRMHAATKAGALGAGLILLGAAVASADVWVAMRAAVGLAFLVLTAPLGAHLLARAALKTGTPKPVSTSIDEDANSQ